MPKKDRLRDSNVVRVNPDSIVELSLIEIKELLLNGVLRIPTIANEGHHLGEHGWMPTHIEAPSQTNNLPGGGEDPPSETERRSLQTHQIMNKPGMTRTA